MGQVGASRVPGRTLRKLADNQACNVPMCSKKKLMEVSWLDLTT